MLQVKNGFLYNMPKIVKFKENRVYLGVSLIQVQFLIGKIVPEADSGDG